MKHVTLMFTILLALASIGAGQKLANHGLVFTGSVQGVETKCINGKPAMQVRVYAQFRNDGETALILIYPSYVFTTRVSFVGSKPGDPAESIVAGDVARYNPYLDNPYGTASGEDYDPLTSYVYKLDTAERPQTIPPGGYREFTHWVAIRNGFSIEVKPNETRKECGRLVGTPVPDYPAFYLEYHLSLKKYDRGTDLLKTLQTRWKRFGHLLLDSNGDVSYKTEKIYFETSK